ncbi:MAG: three-Cys-motif partner protein TcmP [Maricaulaceae bacterium]|nr:three-Cys-motif partner protein TcmP [Maricaulaceae bacterium]
MSFDEDKLTHKFGGPWTEIKLDAVQYYLKFFTNALKNKPTPEHPFELWYIDAFAGAGERAIRNDASGLFGIPDAKLGELRLAGSAKRALSIDPPFSRFVFVEIREEFVSQLERLRERYNTRNIRCIKGDANEVLPSIFNSSPWKPKPRWGERQHRAVVFLDPYDLVDWETLTCLSSTGAVDLWLLFPIGSVLRQAANDFSKVVPEKARYLDRAFGCAEWRDRIYEAPAESSLFPDYSRNLHRKRKADVEAYYKERLETLFPYVSDPLPLLTARGAQIFSLYFAVSNKSTVAQDLARRCIADLTRHYRVRGSSSQVRPR